MRAAGRDVPILIALAAALCALYGAFTRHGPALADEHFYLASARFFGDTLSLNARFYDAWAIVRFGHPHHEWHTPGYVLLLGPAIRLLRDPYLSAIALNGIAYAALALLARSLGLALGLERPAAFAAGALALLMPAYLPYVFWAMPEVLLGTLFLASLTVAARRGAQPSGAAAAGLVLGLGVLVRETVAFGLPALLGLLWHRRGRWRVGLLAFALFLALVHLPLQAGRPGGAAFWRLPWGHPAAAAEPAPSGAAMLAALKNGQLVEATRLALQRASWNAGQLAGPAVGVDEKGVLGYFAILALAASVGSRACPLGRGLLLGLWLSLLALVALLFGAYSIASWGGFRYLMFLVPALLPFVAAPLRATQRRSLLSPALFGLAGVVLAALLLQRLTDYKASRQGRWERLTAYVEERIDASRVQRIVLPNGWLFGLKHYPVEVISSLVDHGGHLRALEERVWFDYLVVPATFQIVPELETRTRYQRVNAGEVDPPLYIYRRVR